ncbi:MULTISPECIES: DUF4160 domain-containing protein [Rubrivirga]|uniref:DUF4160 domain-containing protein n=1 Tax=Rubrivirga TaxID=1434037 RepID=UPI0032C23694
MPTVSEFYGILIRLYWRDTDRHQTPHFHARYAEHEAAFSIPDAEVLAGKLPRRQRRLVQAWAELHAEELERAWSRAVNGEAPGTIVPLR